MSKSYATFVFKSGATVDADVSEVETSRNRLDGELTRVTWTNHEDARRRLMTINLKNVDAVVFHEGDG